MANIKDLKMVEPIQRLRGSLSKIGIRPLIDGRHKGVRESLENQIVRLIRPRSEPPRKKISAL